MLVIMQFIVRGSRFPKIIPEDPGTHDNPCPSNEDDEYEE
jgi:hypothetical protein